MMLQKSKNDVNIFFITIVISMVSCQQYEFTYSIKWNYSPL